MRGSPTAPARPPTALWLVAAAAIATAAAAAAALLAAGGRAASGDNPWEGAAGPALIAVTVIASGLTGLIAVAHVFMSQPGHGDLPRPRDRDPLSRLTLGVAAWAAGFGIVLLVAAPANPAARAGLIVAAVATVVALVLAVATAERLARRVDPEATADRIAADAVAGIRRRHALPEPEVSTPPAGELSHVLTSPRGGVLQAVDAARLAAWADRHGWRIVIPHALGEPIAAGEPLLEVHGAGEHIPAVSLRAAVRVGPDRSVGDDPGYAIRTLADLAIHALSPASLDPTRAVRIIDHLEPVLVAFGQESLTGAWAIADRAGRPCVEMPAPTWPDLLALALTEIREYGETSPQVTRRLRALLERLRTTIRPEHRAAVDIELAELSSAVRRSFPDPVLRRFAGCADRQGIGAAGGSSRWGDAPGRMRP